MTEDQAAYQAHQRRDQRVDAVAYQLAQQKRDEWRGGHHGEPPAPRSFVPSQSLVNPQNYRYVLKDIHGCGLWRLHGA
jgi:hypothetical protein